MSYNGAADKAFSEHMTTYIAFFGLNAINERPVSNRESDDSGSAETDGYLPSLNNHRNFPYTFGVL